ncbi:MAG: DNA-binding response regulator [bacterium]
MMPKKDGYEVCRTLKTDADAYVLKPFRQKELAVRVRKLIELRRKLRQRYSTATVIKPAEVEANLGEEEFSVETLAGQAAMSLPQLNRKLNALIGQPAGQMLRSMRLQRAADLLAKKSGNVAEICYVVGFSDQANFTRSQKAVWVLAFGVSKDPPGMTERWRTEKCLPHLGN